MPTTVLNRMIGVGAGLALALPAALVVTGPHRNTEVGLVATAAPVATRPVTVSFTFDDTFADQVPAADVLHQHGMAGTFYVNSPRLSTTSLYMTRAQASALQAAGHEIAGHTLGHVDLAAVDSTEVQHQVCDDRTALTAMGYHVTSFAYPFGSTSPTVKQAVADCGYTSARSIGDLRSPTFGCFSCATAEAIPPMDRWQIRTNTSVQSNATAETLEQYVTQAENDNGGWVPLVFHHICSGCSTLAMDPATFSTFVEWLAQRPSTTQVRTVEQVISGTSPPPPAPTPTPVVAPPPTPAIVTPTPAASPPGRSRITADASPERVRRGAPVTVRGRLTRQPPTGARYVALVAEPVALQRQIPSGTYTTVRTIRTSAGGYVVTRVRAAPGNRCYRWVYRGSPATLPAASARDCVHVGR